MLVARYPPIVPGYRWMWFSLRAIGLFVLACTLWVAAPMFGDGRPIKAIFLVAGAGGLAGGMWLSPYAPALVVLLPASLIVFSFGVGWSAMSVLAVAGVLVLALLRLSPVRLDPDSVRAVSSDELPATVAASAARFVELGWSLVGGLHVDLMRRGLAAAILHAADGRSYAEAADTVFSITSLFADGRTLVTRSSGASSLPPEALENTHRGARADELTAAHAVALSRLAAEGVEPLPLRRETVVDLAIAQEKSAIRASAAQGRRLSMTLRGLGPLDGSSESARRIAEWATATSPPLSD